MNQVIRASLTGTPETLVELLQDKKGIILLPGVQTGVKNAISIEISEFKVDPRTFFDRFETFIEAWRFMSIGMSGKQAVKEAEAITDIGMSFTTFYNRRKKYAVDLEHLRRSYWAALSRLPFKAEDDRFPVLVYRLRARPDRQVSDHRNPPYEFAGLCSQCYEKIFGLILPDTDYRWFCVNCGRRIEFEPHPLDWGKRWVKDECG